METRGIKTLRELHSSLAAAKTLRQLCTVGQQIIAARPHMSSASERDLLSRYEAELSRAIRLAQAA